MNVLVIHALTTAVFLAGFGTAFAADPLASTELALAYKGQARGTSVVVTTTLIPPSMGGNVYTVDMTGIDVSSGTQSDTQLTSRFDTETSELIDALNVNENTGQEVTSFKREVDDCVFPPAAGSFCYVHKDWSKSTKTAIITQPHFEFTPIDFLSAIPLVMNYHGAGRQNSEDYSLLLGRTLKHVIMRRAADGAVELYMPATDAVGIRYEISVSPNGKLYPSKISLNTSRGYVDLVGGYQ